MNTDHFQNVLNELETAKSELLSDCKQMLSLTGVVPEATQKAMQSFLRISGSVFAELPAFNVPIERENDFYIAEFGEEKYYCPVGIYDRYVRMSDPSNILMEKSASVTVTQTIAEPLPKEEVSSNENEFATEMAESPINIHGPEPAAEEAPVSEKKEAVPVVEEVVSAAEETISETPAEETKKTYSLDDILSIDEDSEFEEDEVEEEKTKAPATEEPVSEKEEEFFTDVTEPAPAEETLVTETPVEEAPAKPAPVLSIPKPTIIGGEIKSLNRSDFFVEEKEKEASELCYVTYKLSAGHRDVPGKRTEFTVMVAPLKVLQHDDVNCPIVAAFYSRGDVAIASSYDNKDGKNTVEISIDDYEFIVRGTFTNGIFDAKISTTGISSTQGDIISVITSQKYNPTGKNVRNGHIKFHYTSAYGPGTIEVFPFEAPGENSFIIVEKNDEFTESYYLAPDSMHRRVFIFGENSKKMRLECAWENDKMISELL